MPIFLDDVHTVEGLNEPVDDCGLERPKLFVNIEDVLSKCFSQSSLFFNNFRMFLHE